MAVLVLADRHSGQDLKTVGGEIPPAKGNSCGEQGRGGAEKEAFGHIQKVSVEVDVGMPIMGVSEKGVEVGLQPPFTGNG